MWDGDAVREIQGHGDARILMIIAKVGGECY